LLEVRAPRLDLLHGHLEAEVPLVRGILVHPGRVQQRQVELAIRQDRDAVLLAAMNELQVEGLLIPLAQPCRVVAADRDVSELRHGRASSSLRPSWQPTNRPRWPARASCRAALPRSSAFARIGWTAWRVQR